MIRIVVHLRKEIVEARLNEGPSSLVLGLLLYPFNCSVGVSGQRRLDISEWEGSKLLDTDDSDVFDTTFGSFCFEIVVDLSTAEEDLSDLIVRYQIGGCLLNHSLEPKTDFEIFNFRVGTTVFQ